MELKLNDETTATVARALLIVPYGIETRFISFNIFAIH